MSDPFVGEIRIWAGSVAPSGWAFCSGQLLPIAENEVLFQLIGTTYGGDGAATFALPDLRGRVPVHQGNGFPLAQAAGVESVTLTVQQIPAHTHTLQASLDQGGTTNPATNTLGQVPGGGSVYIQDAPAVALAAQALSPVGGSQPHENLQPFVCVNFIIALFGEFPPAS